MIVLETALPIKFAATIVEALGHEPERPARFEGIEDPAQARRATAGRRRRCQALHRRPCLMPRGRAPAAAEPGRSAGRACCHGAPPRRASARSKSPRRSMHWAACWRPMCARPSMCRRWTTPRWTATRCAPPTCRRRRALLPVSQRIPAGSVGVPLEPAPRRASSPVRRCRRRRCGGDAGACARPTVDGARCGQRTCRSPAQWIRRAGEDMRAGPPCWRAGTRLAPQASAWPRRSALATLPVSAPPARGAVFHRRRTGDAGRAAARPGASTTPTASCCARCCRRWAARSATCGIVPDSLRSDARGAARAAARARPDPHPRRRVGRRGRSCQAGGRSRRARSSCGRSRSSRASRWRSAQCVRRRLAKRFHRPAGQSGVELRHLPACRAPVAACICRARGRRCRQAFRCARISTGRRPDAARVPARAHAMPTAAWTCSQPEFRRADLRAWADGLVDNPAGARSAAATRCAYLPFSESDRPEGRCLDHVTVAYFAALREARLWPRESTLPAGVNTRGRLRDWLVARGRTSREASATAARAQRRQPGDGARRNRRLNDGAEVAFFPPVTGG